MASPWNQHYANCIGTLSFRRPTFADHHRSCHSDTLAQLHCVESERARESSIISSLTRPICSGRKQGGYIFYRIYNLLGRKQASLS